MRDIFFYPLSALVVAAIISYAMSFSEETGAIDILQGYTLAGEDLQYLQLPGQLELMIITDSKTGAPVARLTSNANIKSTPTSPGINVRLGPEFETAFAGQFLDIIIRARQGDISPTPKFQIAYFVAGIGGSGWKQFTPTDSYVDYKISYKNPASAGQVVSLGDYVGIWPDLDGNGATLNVSSITVKRAGGK